MEDLIPAAVQATKLIQNARSTGDGSAQHRGAFPLVVNACALALQSRLQSIETGPGQRSSKRPAPYAAVPK
jgi:hypothetical protein